MTEKRVYRVSGTTSGPNDRYQRAWGRSGSQKVDPDLLALYAAAIATCQLAYDVAGELIRRKSLPGPSNDTRNRAQIQRALARWGNALHTIRPAIIRVRDAIVASKAQVTTRIGDSHVELNDRELGVYYSGLGTMLWAAYELSGASRILLKSFGKAGVWVPHQTGRAYENWVVVSDRAQSTAAELRKEAVTPSTLANALSACLALLESLEELESALRAVWYSATTESDG